MSRVKVRIKLLPQGERDRSILLNKPRLFVASNLKDYQDIISAKAQGREMTSIIGTDYGSREAETLSDRKVIDVSNAVPSAAHMVERSFCQTNVRAMGELRSRTKRPGVQKKTSTSVPKMLGQRLKTSTAISW
jgi:hypothetical protein